MRLGSVAAELATDADGGQHEHGESERCVHRVLDGLEVTAPLDLPGVLDTFGEVADLGHLSSFLSLYGL